MALLKGGEGSFINPQMVTSITWAAGKGGYVHINLLGGKHSSDSTKFEKRDSGRAEWAEALGKGNFIQVGDDYINPVHIIGIFPDHTYGNNSRSAVQMEENFLPSKVRSN